MKNAITCMLLLMTVTLSTSAQQKGSFNSNTTFNGNSRTLSYFVPQNYDTNQTYTLMVCLHGLGDNSNNYRDALINALSWPTVFPKTIFVCPDGGSDQNKDFYAPAGDEQIILASINHARSLYRIDTTSILLQGFSLGGRSALKFGLDYPNYFKGLLLSTPAIQDITDLNNTPGTSLNFNYGNAPALPICISVGKEDFAYSDIVTKLVGKLKRENGAVLFESIPNMGHGVAGTNFSNKVYPFINKLSQPDFDIEIFDAAFQQQQCGTSFPVSIWVYNNGKNTIHNLAITATGLGSQTWEGNIPPHHSQMIPLTIQTTHTGVQPFSIGIATNSVEPDPVLTNNNYTSYTFIKPTQSPSSINAGFDQTDSSWSMPLSGSMFRWYLDSTVKKSGAACMAMFNLPLAFYTRGNKEYIYSPVVDINALTYKQMSFDLAFNYNQYTPPYVAATTNFADTLEISISTDCGNTYTVIYKKGGQELATADAPIINPLSFEAATFIPNAQQWRKENIDLSSYNSQTQALFRFTCISGMGGSLYIDNFNVGDLTSSVKNIKLTNSTLGLYPNPASDVVYFQQPINEPCVVHIFDQMGRLINKQHVNQVNNNIHVEHLASGIYWVTLQNSQETSTQKLVIEH